ncbi:protelomerase family protein [Cyanothece sp. BG0011]|uniref:protelomerase family protein n=1 Tax=Cyanothece sp. BG0011 TaxID=2082950 RepID=UPI000D1EF4F8|nr:protelomerase family protein [Cyanothece sp. BG0011]
MEHWLKEWGKGKPPAGWVIEIIDDTLTRLEGMTKEDETEIAQLNNELTEKFLKKVKPTSVKNYYTCLHKAVRIHFKDKLTAKNSINHPTKGKREHFACTLIDTPDDIKALNLGLQREALDWKQHNVAHIEEPDLIVNRGRELLESAIATYEKEGYASYADIGASLALLVGLRPGEILRDAVLKPSSPYTIILSQGQAKTRGKNRAYEMPTLIEADTVLKGYNILRNTFKADKLNDLELETYKNNLRFQVELNFREIVPTLSRLNGETTVNPQRLRAVYDAIAVFYYCPPQVKDFVYIKAINGHEPTPGKADAAMHYLDYQIGDGAIVSAGGQRQGIKLGQPGVKIIKAIADKLETTDHEKALMRFLSNESQPVVKESVDSDITPEVLGLSPEWVKRLGAVMEETGQTDFKAMVCELVKQEIKFREGLRNRHEGKDFQSMPLSKLKRIRHRDATAEKIRRAFLAIKHHNSHVASERSQRWYINPTSIHKLVGGRFSSITPWCEAHKDEIDSHNQTYELSEGDNRKSVDISEMIEVPEYPMD